MTVINRIVYLFSFLYFFASCNFSEEKSIENILSLSGDNRSEWERVLRYYSPEGDSLKKKAALFLLRNMPGHYTLEGGFIDRFNNRVRDVYPQKNYAWYKTVQTVPEKIEYGKLCYKAYDLEWLDGEFIILHIENMFRLWQTTPWLKNLDFQDFCEYLLPYRISNERPDNFSDSVVCKVENLKNEIQRYPMQFTPTNLYELLKECYPDKSPFQYITLALGDGNSSYTFDCLHATYYDIFKLRLVGLPVALDYVPFWGRRDGRHYWCTIIDPLFPNKMKPIDIDCPSKVYRCTFSHQPCPQESVDECVTESLATPFIKDVTSYYANTSTVVQSIKTQITNPRYAYLCVFNEQEWSAVSWAEIKKGKAVFRQMGRGIVYLPVYYDRYKQCTAGNPFILHENGRIEELIADTNNRQTIRIMRKTPVETRKIKWSQTLKGGYMEMSNDPDFKNSKIVAYMDSVQIDHNVITLAESESCRFGRLTTQGHSYLGELVFFDKNGNKIMNNMSTVSNYKKYLKHEDIFDSNPLSFGLIYGEIVVDFGKAVDISKIYYLPRNDANAIFPGNRYELKYHNGKEWISLGTKTAEDYYIDFTNVPKNALYWLRNLTIGTEERIFIYKDSKQIFY